MSAALCLSRYAAGAPFAYDELAHISRPRPRVLSKYTLEKNKKLDHIRCKGGFVGETYHSLSWRHAVITADLSGANNRRRMSQDNSPQDPDTAVPAGLNAGEIACLQGVSSGLGSKEIARKLDISPHTVDARLKTACRKLGTKSRFVAAKILEEAYVASPFIAAAAGDTNLVYEILDLPSGADDGDKGPSAREGDGLDDLEQNGPRQLESTRDSGAGKSWLEPSRPIANFFGGENRLSIWQRIIVIVMIAMAAGLTFGVLLNGFAGVSKLLSSP